MLTDRSRIARPVSRLALCSSLAIATALIVGASAARAQSFQGNGNVVSGNATITTGTGTTNIDVGAMNSDVVIDWSTFDTNMGGGPIDFQLINTTATFQSSNENFHVLNRIFPTDPSRAIQFNGTVISTIQNEFPGGTVFFYSPGGVILGGSAVFDVGNLGLTSAAPVVDVNGCFTCTPEGVVAFSQANAGTAVSIQASARITSSGGSIGNYVAIVAPQIDQRGIIDVDGVAALVSADAATITFNTGLFDIQVTSGTSSTGFAGNGRTLVNTGTITGPAFQGTGVPHRIYLVAVPKNDAITMIIGDGSTLGFNIAGAADVVGNAVILSAGYDVVGGNVATTRSAGGGTGSVMIDAFNADFTSDVRARSTGRTIFASDGGVGAAGMSFAAGVAAHSDTIVSLEARNNGPLDVVGNVFLDADVTATANGAAATGGQAYLDARGGADLTVGGSVLLSAVGTGATSTSSGGLATGNGTGGSASLNAITGGSIAITGNVGLDASGHAGFTEDSGVDGGNGTGGFVNVTVSGSGSSIGVGGNLTAFASGFGGDGTGCTTCSDDGGVGQGGQILVQAASGPAQINITGNVDLDSSGFGGNSLSTLAGAGIGGRANIGTNVNSTITIGGFADVTADGFGGDDLALSGVGGGGAGTGGLAELGVFQGGTVDVTSFISTSAVGHGGVSLSSGGPAGSGTGGIAQLYHDTAGSLIARSGVTLFAGGVGGNAVGNAVAGGNGTGGQARAILYNAGTSSLTITGGISAFANGLGGAGLTAGGTGGSGTGGTARLGADAAGKTVTVAGSVNLNAKGFGGNGFAAGTGQGGNAMVAANGSSTVTITAQNSEDSVFIGASGRGGSVDVVGGDSGAGVGGIAQIVTNGGATLTVTVPDTFLEADGQGGDALSLTGNGGAGNGGRALLIADGGSATFNGNVSLSGDSAGGNGINGGTAFGDPESNLSRAFVFARNGSLGITGMTSLHATASGGTGNLAGNGGNATGGFANVAAANGVNTTGFGIITLGGDLDIDSGAFGGDALGTGNGGNAGAGRAHLFVNGGTITVGGDVILAGDAHAGDGINGGNAISARPFRQPRALIGSFNGTITVAGSSLLGAPAFGGNGSSGGTGGIAYAGLAAVDAQSNNGPSAINLSDLLLVASAAGGFGGSGGPGQAGGAGGEAYGGIAVATGNAGQGDLTVTGDTIIDASAVGGFGGLGGSGATTAPGSAGGAGGRAIGGAITVGTVSGVDTPSNTGSATFGLVSGDADALGGGGGHGGSGTAQGNGGAGGAGFGGSAGILVRGSPATFGDVTFTANGVGGVGGPGTTPGDGGDGYAGDGFVVATQRFMRTERGTLDAGNVTITSAGIGGAGATVGDSFYSAAQGPEGDFFVRQADVSLGSLSLTTLGNLAPNVTTTILQVVDDFGIPVPTSVTVTAEPFDLSLADSTVDIANSFTLSTPGAMRVSLDASTVNTTNLTLNAGNFVLAATRPETLGTFNVSGNLNLFSGLDFLAYANFSAAGTGFFEIDGSVLVGDLTFDDGLEIDALGSIATGAIVAGEFIDLTAGGTVTTGQLTAGDSVGVSATGAVTIAGASAGIVNPSTNVEAEYNIGLRSLTSIVAGDLTARESVGLASPGTIAVGNVTTGSDGLGFLALAGTGLTTGSIDTTASANGGRVYLANFSMEALGGEIGGDIEFDPEPIFAATPVAIGGPIMLNGAVSTGRFQAATTGAFTAQAITAPNGFELSAGAAVTLGDLTSFTINVSSALSLTLGAVTSTATSAELAALGQSNGVTLTAANGALATGAITSAGSIDLIGALALTTGAVNVSGGSVEMDTNGALLTGDITSGQSIRLFAGTTATTGNLVAGNSPNTQFSVGVAANGAVTTGNIVATRDIGLLSQNSSVTAGNIGTATNLGVLTRGAVTLGSVTTGTAANNFLYIANASLAPLGGALGPNFNPAPIFAATPVATTGPITIRGPINTGNLIAATTGTLSIGSGPTPTDLNLVGVLNLTAGGALALGNVNALGIRLQSGSTITGGALTSREAINVSGAGAITLGNLSAGIVNPTTSGVDRNIGVVSTGSSLTAGTVAAGTDVGLAAGGGNLTAGTIMAGDDVLLLARDAVSVGSITAGAADGRILIANASLRSLGDVVNDVDPDAIFNAMPAPVTGAITIGGPVTGTTFSAAANGDFTAGALTLGQRITIGRAATALVNGAWVAPTISIASQKLQFGTSTSAMIGGTGTTSLTLRALASGQQAVFGGSTQGSGYTLTQTDFGRIRSSNLTLQVDAQGVSSTTPDLEIRDLTLTGSAGSGSSAVTITTPGSLRVVGDLLLSQAGAMDTLAVTANRRLELVLPEGSIAITGAGGALAGTLTLSSDNLVAGTLDLLAQIMADPEAAGLADALKTPASTTSNLAGYIRASGVKLLSNANILLQNSGTARDFAGVTVGGGGLIIGRITPATGGTTGGTTSGGTTTTSGFSFTGMLVTANDILMFEFRVDAASTVTLRTYSYAGGTNQAGQVIPAGGFDPILALFDAAGALINQNDDGGSNVPADPVTGSRYDTFLTSMLAPGNYTVSVSVFSNFAIGPNLSNGFDMNETDFGSGRTANFAFDVLGAATATGPGSQTPSGPLNVIGFGRQTDASGQTVSGNNFFAGINFGTGSEGTVEYNDISQFNTCFVNGACQGPSMPDADPVAAISSEITVITGAVLDDSPVAPTADDSDEGDESGSNEPEDEDNADDEGSSPIAPPTPLISTRALDGDVTVVEPVSGAGNPALYGSAVNETTVEGETP